MKRDDYALHKLMIAQRRRQAILDRLTAHPGSDYDDVVAAVMAADPEAPPSTVRGLVAHMLLRGEIAAVGAPRDRTYTALVETTASAESLRAAYLARQRKNNARNAPAYAERKRAEREAQARPPALLSKFEQADANQMRAQEFLRTHPGAAPHQVRAELGITTDALALQLLVRMERRGLARRDGKTRSASGKPCAAWYAADIAVTERRRVAAREPWKTTHIGGRDEDGRERGPIKGQGGQGAVGKHPCGSGMYSANW